jgi:O-antigen/teichoic acid export membrane protein
MAALVIRALVGIGALQFLSLLLLVVRTKTLALATGVEGVGTIASVDALTAVITQTLSLSLPFAALRFLPPALRSSPAEADLLYRRMRLVLLSLLLPASIGCILVALVAPAWFGAALVPYRRTMILAFAGLPVVGLMPFLTNAYAGAVGHMQSMRITIAHAAVMIVAAAVAASGLGVDGFYATYALLGTVLVVVASRRLAAPGFSIAERLPLVFLEAIRLPGALWRFGAWLLPLAFLAPYAAWFVRYTTLKLYGADSAGVLQGAIGISLSVRALLGAAHPVFLTPNVNRHPDSASRMEWANQFQRTTGLVFALTLPPLLLYSDVALRVLYARAFLAGSAFVALFVAAEVISLLSGTYQSLIVAGDRMRFHVLQNLAAQTLLVATAAIALPRIGLAGAGLASLFASTFMFGSTLAFLRFQFGVRASAAAARTSLIAVAILVIAGGIGSRYPGLAPGILGAKAAACVALWLAAFLLIPSEDRAQLRHGLQLVARRLTVRASS